MVSAFTKLTVPWGRDKKLPSVQPRKMTQKTIPARNASCGRGGGSAHGRACLSEEEAVFGETCSGREREALPTPPGRGDWVPAGLQCGVDLEGTQGRAGSHYPSRPAGWVPSESELRQFER